MTLDESPKIKNYCLEEHGAYNITLYTILIISERDTIYIHLSIPCRKRHTNIQNIFLLCDTSQKSNHTGFIIMLE